MSSHVGLWRGVPVHRRTSKTMAAPAETTTAELQRLLEVQKAARRTEGPPSIRERERRLDVMIQLLLANQERLVACVTRDFGVRPAEVTKFADILMALEAFKTARHHVRGWCKAERRRVDSPLNAVGASNCVEYQPKGVVGIIAPWNYPIMLLLTPMASALAAGDSILLKPSELAPRTAALMAQLINEAFAESVARVVLGGPAVSSALASLELDHLVFTGSTRVGKLVAQACAANLVPCTLELGGKCPVIIGTRARIYACAKRIAHGKILNSGQTCLAPDYVFVEEGRLDEFVQAFEAVIAEMFPEGVMNSGDYASVISPHHGDRLRALVAEARRSGCRIVECRGGDAAEAHVDAARRVAPTLICGASEQLRVSSEELFGPLLVVRPYVKLSDAVQYITARPKPLAFYYLGPDRREERRALDLVSSGGATVNDTIMHVGQEDLPFGGVGASGSGRTRGRDGFRELSNCRGVHRRVGLGAQLVLDGLYPPYDRRANVVGVYLWLKMRALRTSRCGVM